MSQINFENVSKRYKVRHSRYRSLREDVAGFIKNVIAVKKQSSEDFWALNDVSFEVKKGEALGIIGRNGAGKTTILKLLSKITYPTSGKININGRAASLIEVGTGFHPELTGRENIYLYGSIMGMKRNEINQKFDSIIEFSELEQFIDMPLKRYSSGMYVRLGFSVAVHTDPDVLLVDEVLSVGDLSFQGKCVEKMKSFRNTDVAIIFVSHSMGSVNTMCDKTLWLDKGKVVAAGENNKVINDYFVFCDRKMRDAAAVRLKRADSGLDKLKFIKTVLLDRSGKETNEFNYKDDVIVRVYYESSEKIKKPYFMLSVESYLGALFGANMLFDNNRPEVLNEKGHIDCVFKSVSLLPGTYQIIGGVRHEDGISYLVHPEVIASFNIITPIEKYGYNSEMALSVSRVSSPVIVPYEWKF